MGRLKDRAAEVVWPDTRRVGYRWVVSPVAVAMVTPEASAIVPFSSMAGVVESSWKVVHIGGRPWSGGAPA